ncbi:MAG: DNA mismatch repair protein MutL, partial [Flavobacteriales bacterium]|nr:DNA mismatch repair protein MutL [Flavobacteriales bacterium]
YSQNDLMVKSMAKSLAIKTGTPLTKDQQEHLVNSLFACKEPSVSPTNRATFVTIPLGDLDRKFV